MAPDIGNRVRWRGNHRDTHRVYDPESWALRGKCRRGDPDALFVRGRRAQGSAKRICAGCPVQWECLTDALDNGVEWGVWGGMTEYERRALRRTRPQTTRWRALVRNLLDAQSGSDHSRRMTPRSPTPGDMGTDGRRGSARESEGATRCRR